MKKKFTAVLLCVVLLLTLSVNVSAEDLNITTDTNTQITDSEIGLEPIVQDETVSTLSATEGIISGAVYRIRNIGSNKYMNVHYGVDADGTNIYQWAADSSTEQRFRVVYFADSDSYLLYAICSSSRVVSVARGSSGLASGQNVHLYTANDATAQGFKIVSLGQSQFNIVMKENPNLYLTAYGDSNGTSGGTGTTSAGNIFISNCEYTMYQYWTFELVENPPDPIGNFEEVSASRIKGWAYQTGLPDTPIQAHIYIKNNSSGAEVGYATFADQYRADLYAAGIGDGDHAFDYSMNWCSYPSGTYTVSVYGINAYGGTNPHLGNSLRTFTVRQAGGNMEALTSTGVNGWAWKPDAPDSVIEVHLYVRTLDGETVYAYPVFADIYRSDLYAAGYGNGYHGYSIPIDWSTLPEEKLRVTLYAVDGSGENPAFYDGYYENRKRISLLGMVENKYFHDLSTWSMTDEVATYCENIGCSYLFRTNRADDDIFTNCIKNSSYCVIYTHGEKTEDKETGKYVYDSIQWSMKNVYNTHADCEEHDCYTCFGHYTTDDLKALPNNYFSTTRCVVLMSCESGNGKKGDPTNFVNVLQSKGVWTVVGFEKEISYCYDNTDENEDIHTDDIVNATRGGQLWITVFTRLLSEGKTVYESAKDATAIVYETQIEYEKKYGVDDKDDYLGLDSYYIAGDEDQIVKH